jgi:hypothetical protein
MNTDKDKLQAYRETMRRGEAAWQSGQPKYQPFSSTEEEDLFKETPTKENYYDRVPGLKKVNELQFGDIYRMHEGPEMDKYVKPRENWRTFVGLNEGEHPGSHILTSTRLGNPTDFHYADILNRRFETLDKDEADAQDISY